VTHFASWTVPETAVSNPKEFLEHINESTYRLAVKHFMFFLKHAKRLQSSLSPSVREEQQEKRWKDFHEIWYWRHLRNIFQQFGSLFRSKKFKNHLTWRLNVFFRVSLWLFIGEKYVSRRVSTSLRRNHKASNRETKIKISISCISVRSCKLIVFDWELRDLKK
jgi:hypothetical protein